MTELNQSPRLAANADYTHAEHSLAAAVTSPAGCRTAARKKSPFLSPASTRAEGFLPSERRVRPRPLRPTLLVTNLVVSAGRVGESEQGHRLTR
jgi:hypothetical protein